MKPRPTYMGRGVCGISVPTETVLLCGLTNHHRPRSEYVHNTFIPAFMDNTTVVLQEPAGQKSVQSEMTHEASFLCVKD